MATKVQTCPYCGGAMKYGVRSEPVEYKGERGSVRVEGWRCDECGEGILTGEELKKFALAVQALKAKVEHVLSPSDVARIRERLRLSQRKAGEILGGGPRAFQKYESGEQTPSVPMSHLLRLLHKVPQALREIMPISESDSDALVAVFDKSCAVR